MIVNENGIANEWRGKHMRFSQGPIISWGGDEWGGPENGIVSDSSGTKWGFGVVGKNGKNYGPETKYPGFNSKMRRVTFDGKQWNQSEEGLVSHASAWAIMEGDPNDPKWPRRNGIPDAAYLGRSGKSKYMWRTCYSYLDEGEKGHGKDVREPTPEEIEKYIPKE